MFAPSDRVFIVDKTSVFGCLIFSPPVVEGQRLITLWCNNQWISSQHWNKCVEHIPNIKFKIDDNIEFRVDRDLPALARKAENLSTGEGWTTYKNAGQCIKFRATPLRVLETKEFVWACYYAGVIGHNYMLLSTSQLLRFCRTQPFFCCTELQFILLKVRIVESLAIETGHQYPVIYDSDKISTYESAFSLC